MLVDKATTLPSLVWLHRYHVLAVFAIVLVVDEAKDRIDFHKQIFSLTALGLLVAALSIFLVFRVNEAYSRWWEARTLWGGIVNSSRSFARQAISLVHGAAGASGALHQELVYRQIAWVNALRLSLRRQDDWDELAPFLAPEELSALRGAANKPAQLLQTQGERLAEARASGALDPFGHVMLDATLSDLCNYQGGCERIKNTVFPDRVAFFTRVVAWSLCLLIPVSVLDADSRFTVSELGVLPAVMLAFVVTERLGADLKNPFENRANDTPMSALSRTIEIDLRQQLGEKDVPEPLAAQDGILM